MAPAAAEEELRVAEAYYEERAGLGADILAAVRDHKAGESAGANAHMMYIALKAVILVAVNEPLDKRLESGRQDQNSGLRTFGLDVNYPRLTSRSADTVVEHYRVVASGRAFSDHDADARVAPLLNHAGASERLRIDPQVQPMPRITLTRIWSLAQEVGATVGKQQRRGVPPLRNCKITT